MEETRDSLRTQLQKQAALRLEKHKRLMVRWATSVGKSNIMLWFTKWHPDLKALIVVPEINNIQNWEDEFKKFGVPNKNVTIICYASLKNYKYTKWDIVCFDECPHVDTDLRADIISTIEAKHVLALGAVISDEEQALLEDIYGDFVHSRITMDMAIDKGILAEPEVHVCHMLLDDIDRKYKYLGRQCTAREAYMLLNNKLRAAVSNYDAHPNMFTKRQMLQLGSERKRFLGEQKTRAMRILCHSLKEQGYRFICFCSSIHQAEELGGDHAFTSHTPASMKVLEKFNNHEIDSMYVVGKCIEGQNLKDIQCGVIGQLGGKERITTQSIGRIMRSANPVIYIPVYDRTKDESFMESLRSSISDKYIKHYKLY